MKLCEKEKQKRKKKPNQIVVQEKHKLKTGNAMYTLKKNKRNRYKQTVTGQSSTITKSQIIE